MIQLASLLAGFFIGLTGSLICAALIFLKKIFRIHFGPKWGSLPNLPLILAWFFVPLYISDCFRHNVGYLHSPYFYYGEIWSEIGYAVGLTFPFLLLSLGILRALRLTDEAHLRAEIESRKRPESKTAQNTATSIVIPLVFGVVLVGFSFYKIWDNFVFYSKAVSADATILKTESVGGGKGGGHLWLQVEFLDQSGKRVDATTASYQGHGLGGLHVGDKINIFYSPSKEQDVRLKEWNELYFGPGVLFAFGFIFILVGLNKAGKI